MQTCITADYVLCHKDVQEPFIAALKKYITKFFGEDPQKSESYARIISKDHAKRLAGLFEQGKVEFGGKADVETRYVAPTIITSPKLDGTIMVRFPSDSVKRLIRHRAHMTCLSRLMRFLVL